jgi:uncharacterized protein YciI
MGVDKNPDPEQDQALARLLERDYWLVTSTPRPDTTPDEIAAVAPSHVAWLLDLEERGAVLVSGPLTSGPGVRPGSGITVLRAPDEQTANMIAAQDPFVVAELRTFVIQGWRLNEGSISIRVSLGTGAFEWRD